MNAQTVLRKARRLARSFKEAEKKPTFLLSKLLLLFDTNLHFVKIPLIDGVRIYMHASTMSIQRLISRGYYQEEMAFYRYFLNCGDVFVDVGANVGLLSLMAVKAVMPGGHVCSFEPNPKVFRFLVENFHLNSITEGCRLYECALADEEGISKFYARKYSDILGSLSRTSHLDNRSVEVKVSRGDIVLKDLFQITLLKVDVEGAELRVLKGFEGIIDRVKFIMFEADSQNIQAHGLMLDQLVRFLEDRGFKILSMADGLPISLRPNAAIHADLFAVRPRDIEEFEARYSRATSHKE